MSLMFCSLSSGSSGNCYIIRSDEAALLVDAGISGKKINKGIEEMELSPSDISALFITHEHVDHIKSVGVLNKSMKNMDTYATKGTWPFIEEKVSAGRRHVFRAGDKIQISDICVESFSLSHDAREPVGFSFSNKDGRISILTDTGKVTDDAFFSIRDADILVMEANHDPDVLRVCKRPWSVIRRIAGDSGHLSNDAAAECIRACCEYKKKSRIVLLAHMSMDNNLPELAKQVVYNTLGDELTASLRIDVIERDKRSRIYVVEK